MGEKKKGLHREIQNYKQKETKQKGEGYILLNTQRETKPSNNIFYKENEYSILLSRT